MSSRPARRPSPPRRPSRTGRLRRALATGLLAVGLPLLAAPAAVAAPAQPPDPVELNAQVAPSIVFLQMTLTGTLVVPGQGPVGPFESVGTCTGFFVSSSGDIVSAGHCVGPDSGRESFIESAIGDIVAAGELSEAQGQALLPEAMQSWGVAGEDGSGSPTLEVLVAQPTSIAGAVLTSPVEAEVVRFREFTEGDVALLKVDASSTPALPIADTDPPSGTAITSIGFPGNVTEAVDQSRLPNPTFNSGTVASNQVSPTGVPQLGINAAVSQGMSGGPTIDRFGNVVGVNSFNLAKEKQPFNFITDTTDLRDWVSAAQVDLLPPRSAADAVSAPAPAPATTSSNGSGADVLIWVAVGVGVLVVVAGVVLLLARRGRGTPSQASYAPVPAQPGPPAAEWGSSGWGSSADSGWGSDGGTTSSDPFASYGAQPPGPSHGGSATDTLHARPTSSAACPQCGSRNDPDARFCAGCSAMI